LIEVVAPIVFEGITISLTGRLAINGIVAFYWEEPKDKVMIDDQLDYLQGILDNLLNSDESRL
jgi:hypothetical protein